MATCSICLTDIDDQLLDVTRCGHVFHKECIRTWLDKEKTCPLCRTYLPFLSIYDRSQKSGLLQHLSRIRGCKLAPSPHNYLLLVFPSHEHLYRREQPEWFSEIKANITRSETPDDVDIGMGRSVTSTVYSIESHELCFILKNVPYSLNDYFEGRKFLLLLYVDSICNFLTDLIGESVEKLLVELDSDTAVFKETGYESWLCRNHSNIPKRGTIDIGFNIVTKKFKDSSGTIFRKNCKGYGKQALIHESVTFDFVSE